MHSFHLLIFELGKKDKSIHIAPFVWYSISEDYPQNPYYSLTRAKKAYSIGTISHFQLRPIFNLNNLKPG